MPGVRFAVATLALVGGCLSKPERPTDDCLVAISGQGNGVCALDGSGELWCWGSNVGDGTGNDATTPVHVGLGDAAQAVGVGEFHNCTVAGGAVLCWGLNDRGQAGDGTLAPVGTPAVVEGVGRAIGVATGRTHSCAVSSEGTASCWGGNTDGQLGDGTLTSRPEPKPVVGLPTGAHAITVGDGATCARLADRTIWCWGDNTYGLLGDGTTASRADPGLVAGLDRMTQVSMGCHLHACAVRDEDGTVWCWGFNDQGQLGDGGMSSTTFPIRAQVPEAVAEVSVGAFHTCARTVTDRLYCWGANDRGQLGLAVAGPPQPEPIQVAFPGDITAVTTGCFHTCVVDGADAVWCWGDGSLGQLGDGTTANRGVPAPAQPYCTR